MKTYVKPTVRIEKFTLSKHIASCAFDMNLTQEEVCEAVGDSTGEEFNAAGIVIFAESNTDCSTKPEHWQGFCYTNGAAGYNTFNS